MSTTAQTVKFDGAHGAHVARGDKPLTPANILVHTWSQSPAFADLLVSTTADGLSATIGCAGGHTLTVVYVPAGRFYEVKAYSFGTFVNDHGPVYDPLTAYDVVRAWRDLHASARVDGDGRIVTVHP